MLLRDYIFLWPYYINLYIQIFTMTNTNRESGIFSVLRKQCMLNGKIPPWVFYEFFAIGYLEVEV